MAILIIPLTPGKLNYRFSVAIDGIIYTIRIIFNPRPNRYSYILYDAEGNPLYTARILTGTFVTGIYKHLSIPQGRIHTRSPEGSNATKGTLGDSVKMYYVEPVA